MHALVTEGTIKELYARLPASARSTATGDVITPPGGSWTKALAAECGFHEVVETPRPEDTAAETHDWAARLVEGVPTVVWTARAKTAEEIAETNRSAIEAGVADVLEQLEAIATADPATLDAAAALQQLARVQRKTIRYLFNRLDAAE